MRSLDELEPLVPNEDRFPADYIEIIRDQLGRGFEGEEVFVDEHNVVVSQGLPGAAQQPERWGKLDDVLIAGGTQTVSLWRKTGGGWDGWNEDSGGNVTAYAPPTWPAGVSVAKNTFVLVRKINGRWVVVKVTPTLVTVQTTYQVDGTSQKFQKKQRANVAVDFTDDESGWTDVHTGITCE